MATVAYDVTLPLSALRYLTSKPLTAIVKTRIHEQIKLQKQLSMVCISSILIVCVLSCMCEGDKLVPCSKDSNDNAVLHY